MKYIRTKDGRIYDLESKEVSSWEYINEELANNVYREKEAFYCIYYYDENKAPYLETDGKGGHSMDSIAESEILKQADTIEELCDGFYIDDGQEFCPDDIFTYFCRFESCYKYYNKNHIVKYDGYGFIKTSKGLIYVAKMDNEGNLVLI